MISTGQSCPATAVRRVSRTPGIGREKSFAGPLTAAAGGAIVSCMMTSTRSVSAARLTLRAADAAYAAGDDHTAIRLYYDAATQFRRFGCEHAASVLHACRQAMALTDALRAIVVEATVEVAS